VADGADGLGAAGSCCQLGWPQGAAGCVLATHPRHLPLLFIVLCGCLWPEWRSGRVPAPLATSRCKMYDVRRSVHHRMLCALSTEIFYNQHEGGAKQFCSQKKRRGKQKIKNRQSNGSESRNDGLKSGVKPERT